MKWMMALMLAVLADRAPPSAVFVTLGTGGGAIVQTRRAQPANALLVGDAVYLFDIGEGTQRQLRAAGIDGTRVRAVFMGHAHLDHTGGLLPFLVNRWLTNRFGPLPVFGPPGTVAMLTGIAPFYRSYELTPVSIGQTLPPIISTIAPHDLAPDLTKPTQIYRDEHIRVLAIGTDHYHYPAGSEANAHARSYAFRIEAGGRTIVYGGDTGPSKNLRRLAEGADLLVSEVMDRAAIETDLRRRKLPDTALRGVLAHMDLDHSTPVQVGALASAAHVRHLVLTHLVPGRDTETSTAGYTAGIARSYKGRVDVANDLERF